MGTLWRWMVPLVLGLIAARAEAHDADIVYARLWRPEAGGAEVRERLILTDDTLTWLDTHAPAGGTPGTGDIARDIWEALPLSAADGPCPRTATSTRRRGATVELEARFTCGPGVLRQHFALLAVLPPTYKVVLGDPAGGEAGQRFADAARPSLVVWTPGGGEAPEEEGAASGLLGWMELGLTHIFQGADHLAFLLALLLGGGSWRRVLGLVTAFTVAHSLTLGAAALGWLVLGERGGHGVEVAIAVSILWVALENLRPRAPPPRVALTFFFGLMHGLGFAGVLRAQGLGDSVVHALLGFNLGVELGQALVVVALVPLVRLVRRRPRVHQWTVRGLSAVLLLLGGYWLVERAFALIG